MVLSAVLMAFLLIIISFAIDLGYIALTRTNLQAAADAAALAGAQEMQSGNAAARAAAQDYAMQNMPTSGNVLAGTDVQFGKWDTKTRTFAESAANVNAIRVTTRRSEANGNPTRLFFARIMGRDKTDVSASAVAISSGISFRFLIDDEMIDSDVPSIEALASSRRISSDDLISDRNGDGFIDLPPGSTIEVPTGQVGDEGMFDRSTFEGAFPFKPTSRYTTLDFLAQDTALSNQLGTQDLQDVEWLGADSPHPQLTGKKVLDPTPGCDPVDSHSEITALPGDTVHVSPVFKSDVSMQERSPSKYGSPTANLQGERRGLLAFKILSARSAPGGGSYLPWLTIEIIDPSTIDLQKVAGRGAGVTGTVQLVK